MSDERMPYIKRLEDKLIRETKTAEKFLAAMNEALTARYDRAVAARKSEDALAVFLTEIDNAKNLLGGKYA